MRVRYRALALADLDTIFRFLNERSPVGAQDVYTIDIIHVLHATRRPWIA